MGTIFSHAYLRPVWFKCAVVVLPFGSIAVDILSWYVTKYYHPFAWVVMASGAVTGVCFAYMWVLSMLQMWVLAPPAAVREAAHGGSGPSQCRLTRSTAFGGRRLVWKQGRRSKTRETR
jgi:hypothetical protein